MINIEQINRAELLGCVGRVSVQTIHNTSVVRFTMATNRAYRSEDGTPVIETTWHECSKVWKSATPEVEIAKGDYIHVWGRIQIERYTDTDGVERTLCNIVCQKIEKVDNAQYEL